VLCTQTETEVKGEIEMATVIPALRAKMGDTVYYESKMVARELIAQVRPAKESDKWATFGIEERMQREPDLKRIVKEIAPYIANTKDHFFGSLIILCYGNIQFESVKDLWSKVPLAYKSKADDIGFITIDGGSFIVLDGQHRLLALKQIVGNVDNPVEGLYAAQIPDDEVSVIFIEHESNEKTRRIFNKVNRYAKTTSRGDNIITSEDDGYAIVARRLLNDGAPLGVKDAKGDVILVDWKNNTLAARSTKLTTISVVYETVKHILASEKVERLDPKFRPSEEELGSYYELAEKFWDTILEGLEPYKQALTNAPNIPKMREDNAPYSLLFKPAAQIALFRGLIRAIDGKRLSLPEAVKRANKVDWKMSSPLWKDVIIRPNGTIDVRSESLARTEQLIAYLIAADKMSKEEIAAIKSNYNSAKGNEEGEEEELPKPVVKL
jgi:DNA sulfur modification protein DndB